MYFDDATDVCDWSIKVECISQFSSHDIQINDYDINNKFLLPHECNCTQYYECIDGKQILRDCSDGLHYDYVHQICDVPIKAKCNDFTTIPRSSFPTIPDSSKCYDENNEIPHENDCRFYYKCNDGEKILKSCPRNLYFNPKLRVCDYPENVVCNVEGNIPNTSTTIKCEAITETTNIPHETDCNLYYVCENGVGILKKCSPNLVFNPILKVCDFPENYVCKVTHDKNNIKKIDKIVQNLDPFTCIGTCPEEDPDYAVLLPNDDCKKFCMCSGGVAWIQLCPEPLYFDSVEKICKKKKDAVCGIRLYNQDSSFKIDKTVDNDDSLQPLTDENDGDEHETYDRSLDPSSCIGTCFEEDPEHTVLLPNNNCKKFCLCSNGTTYVQPCPELLYFDSIDKACKRKKDAVCAVRSLMVDRIFDDNSVSLSEKDYNERELDNPWYKRRFYNVDPSTCIGICPEEDNGYEELLPHKDCRKFCICRKGLTYVRLCPESLYFHSVEKVCRQKRHAVCATNSFKQYHAITINREDDEDDDKDNSMEFLREDNKHRRHNYLWPHFRNFNPTTCIGICSNSKYAVLHPHTDCKKFCLCNNGFMWIQSCPKSLYFDSIHKRCKEKKEAVCAVRTFNRKRIIVIDKQVNENKRIEVQEMNDEREIHNSWSRLHSHQDVSTCIGTCFDEDYDYAVLLPNLDCRKFCVCSRGLIWIQSCPKSFYFDFVDNVCKLERNAICAVNRYTNRFFTFNKVIDENNSSEEKNHYHKTHDNTWSKLYFSNYQSFNDLDPSTCIGTCPEEDPEYAVLLPNDDCKKFCMCSGGVAWVQPCPDPLYFDSVQKTCKRKKDAVCGVRSI
ncbi:PE1 protein, partial [Acromyrmex heyeri]